MGDRHPGNPVVRPGPHRPDDVLRAFSDLAEVIADCPRGCGHLGPPADPECALDALTGPQARRVAAARRLLSALTEGAAY